MIKNTSQLGSHNNIVAVIPAAGIGLRMNASLPKQYLKIDKKTILEHTINKLLLLDLISKIVVVISPDDTFFAQLPISNHPKIVITCGGQTRADSVLAGLQLLPNDDWVLVHDAARPCVNKQDIEKLIDVVLTRQQGAILATKITDTVKKMQTLHDDVVIESTCDRRLLWAAATPQMFNVGQLKLALISATNQGIEITDEASAMEFIGQYPLLVECRRDNIKVTQPEDLALAAFYLSILEK